MAETVLTRLKRILYLLYPIVLGVLGLTAGALSPRAGLETQVSSAKPVVSPIR